MQKKLAIAIWIHKLGGMIKIIKQQCFDGIALAVQGNPEEVKQEFTALFNWNVIGPRKAAAYDTVEFEPEMASERFGWAWTTEERLKHGLQARIANRLCAERPELLAENKGQVGGGTFKKVLNEELEKTLQTIQTEVFLQFVSAGSSY